MKVATICSFDNWIALDKLYRDSSGFFPYPLSLRDYINAPYSSMMLSKMILLHKKLTSSDWDHPMVKSFDQYIEAFNEKSNVKILK